MKNRVFKVVFVDPQSRMWSVMKGAKRFFSKKNEYGKMPLRYFTTKDTVARPEDKPYLFAFASVSFAVGFINNEFYAERYPEYGVIKFLSKEDAPKGHLEIWEATGEKMELPGSEKLVGAVTPDFYDAYVSQGAPYGTLFCKSIRLVSKVTNLF